MLGYQKPVPFFWEEKTFSFPPHQGATKSDALSISALLRHRANSSNSSRAVRNKTSRYLLLPLIVHKIHGTPVRYL